MRLFLCHVTTPLHFSLLQLHFEPIICRHTFFFVCFLQQLPLFLVSSTFPNKGGSLRFLFFFVSYCFLAFFQHHIAGVWREHLLKVFQKFEKIEADATLSTLLEFSVLGQTIRFASAGVWNSLWRSLMVFCSPSLIHAATQSTSLFLVLSVFFSQAHLFILMP